MKLVQIWLMADWITDIVVTAECQGGFLLLWEESSLESGFLGLKSASAIFGGIVNHLEQARRDHLKGRSVEYSA